ncbi:hypothetical protein C8A03DRAFT_38385 [Achaetomium macrosporum]|uniref:Uncharacterized protein n=1 Tax=Achaetomium macrosporum TaxID=79813 RepID=A0AAN7C322_9PEZI|nr:hypothetical protein C8A03DRAFT_38385 [Achaetomium macrosporum]
MPPSSNAFKLITVAANTHNKQVADDFAQQMAEQFLHIVQSLSSSGSPLLAFMLLLDVADHSYGKLEANGKASGWENEEFKIQPAEQDMGTEWDENWAILEKWEKAGKRLNKQDFRQLTRMRVDDMHTLFGRRRERREKILKEEGDWVGNALNELVETRCRIEKYGIGEHFFGASIKELAGIKRVDVSEYV